MLHTFRKIQSSGGRRISPGLQSHGFKLVTNREISEGTLQGVREAPVFLFATLRLLECVSRHEIDLDESLSRLRRVPISSSASPYLVLDESMSGDFDEFVPGDFDEFVPGDFDKFVPGDFDKFVPGDFENRVL
ncbi:hypothetical protein AVEN_34610-1 [Araneus ventricosus]|uniref:Uncharacterized protein n=1 Tax=Araneus ventricosus TaxID=182803 RepID=A0A4Y2AZA5_ARAVE|nr:hypothetical protein AVEN_34610-1 [Araneus ventricosus]